MSERPAKLQRLLDAFALLDDRAERIQLLIDTADRFRGVPERVAARPYPATHRTPACESEAYVFAEPREDGTLDFHVAVENPQGISAMALGAIVSETLSGAPLESVAALPGDVVYDLFGRELSMGKNMGLMGMIAMVNHYAKRALAGESVAGGAGGTS